MDKKALQEKLAIIEDNLKKLEMTYHQIIGQKLLIEEMIANFDKTKEPKEEK
jgi:hypothetical protein